MGGFTLIEVVIAFAILGLSLAALYGVFCNSLGRVRRDARLSEATLLAQSLLAKGDIETPGAREGETGEWHGFRYELTWHDLPSLPRQSAQGAIVARVTARIGWSGAGGPREIQISTLKLAQRVPR